MKPSFKTMKAAQWVSPKPLLVTLFRIKPFTYLQWALASKELGKISL